MSYTEIYVLPVKTADLDAYRRFAEDTSRAWLRHGALQVTEYLAVDAKPGVHTSFPQAVKLEADEVVAVGTIVYESAEACARIKAAVMSDPVFAHMDPQTVPVDGKRMFWGGFESFLALSA